MVMELSLLERYRFLATLVTKTDDISLQLNVDSGRGCVAYGGIFTIISSCFRLSPMAYFQLSTRKSIVNSTFLQNMKSRHWHLIVAIELATIHTIYNHRE